MSSHLTNIIKHDKSVRLLNYFSKSSERFLHNSLTLSFDQNSFCSSHFTRNYIVPTMFYSKLVRCLKYPRYGRHSRNCSHLSSNTYCQTPYWNSIVILHIINKCIHTSLLIFRFEKINVEEFDHHLMLKHVLWLIG